MAGDLKKTGDGATGEPQRRLRVVSGAVKVGLVAAVSAVAGGLAVAWWHRTTLEKLRNPVEAQEDEVGDGDFPEIFGR